MQQQQGCASEVDERCSICAPEELNSNVFRVIPQPLPAGMLADVGRCLLTAMPGCGCGPVSLAITSTINPRHVKKQGHTPCVLYAQSCFSALSRRCYAVVITTMNENTMPTYPTVRTTIACTFGSKRKSSETGTQP